MSAAGEKNLHLGFHGRIIDSLGIQNYQSPAAAVTELNAVVTWIDVTSRANHSSAAEV